jgi:hypothetical protein
MGVGIVVMAMTDRLPLFGLRLGRSGCGVRTVSNH